MSFMIVLSFCCNEEVVRETELATNDTVLDLVW